MTRTAPGGSRPCRGLGTGGVAGARVDVDLAPLSRALAPLCRTLAQKVSPT
ncbi:hypothetical protein [Streptomyces sp. NPDC059071]|uniref:hypothetical protein n=1 Tax=unclassified Streptomyces TaxID=2593676 RepID=UPI00362A659E